ncbi:Saposin B-type domain-containing protein [Mycena venus]|uniref:Saposin B-type domain-containing protein n=1 Tax=Mycena venus TaxID=2733690 RepID=A0A8H7CXP1_9AGAR|nr:Saposin B-type domain-containing protein [Mycena venus]
MSVSPPQIPPLDGVLGAPLIGAVLGTFLFGIVTLQTYHYNRLYPTDSKALKILVFAVWFIELAHSISLWHALYQINVTFYGQLAHFFNPPHSLELTVLFSALINVVVQARCYLPFSFTPNPELRCRHFFALRIRKLSGQWFIPVVCSLVTTARFTLSMIMLVAFWDSTSGFDILQTKLHWAMIGVSALGPCVDGLTAGTLCFYLWKIRSTGSHFEQMRTMVDTLIVWSMETTTVTSAASILMLILFLSRTDLAWLTVFVVQPKLFSNSLLAHLNGRQRFRNCTTIHHMGTDLNFDTPSGTQERSIALRMETMPEGARDTGTEKTGLARTV